MHSVGHTPGAPGRPASPLGPGRPAAPVRPGCPGCPRSPSRPGGPSGPSRTVGSLYFCDTGSLLIVLMPASSSIIELRISEMPR